MPPIVDPGPWIRARIAEETAPLRVELEAATSSRERARLRWQILRTSARIRASLQGGGGPAKF